MNKYFFIYLLIFIFAVGCKTPEARKPVSVKSGSFIKESVERNRQLYAAEEEEIKTMIEEDSLKKYIISEHGFWYYYVVENPSETETAGFGDLLEFEYDIKDLEGKIIYSRQELGKNTYRMEKEEMISGLREGLKLMKEGETVTFVFPSYKAYGYYGDLERIGTNMPIISTVTLHNIEQSILTKP